MAKVFINTFHENHGGSSPLENQLSGTINMIHCIIKHFLKVDIMFQIPVYIPCIKNVLYGQCITFMYDFRDVKL
jgi:hypothetical protein